MVRHVQPHRKAGVCIAIVGFLPLFAGIMMIAVSNTAAAQEKSDPVMKGIGPACLAVGIACILGGFLFQFVKHKLWKAKLKQESEDKYVYTSRPGSSNSSNSSSKVARCSIEEQFDDINEITEVPAVVTQDEVQDIRFNTKDNNNMKKAAKPGDIKGIRRVRTIEDELKELQHQQQVEGTSNPLSDREIVGAEGGHASLPGSMYNLHDSD